MPNFNKVCRDCKESKSIECYYWDSWKESYARQCKDCRKLYYKKTRDRQIAYAKQWNSNNLDKKYANYKRWAKTPQGKGLRQALEQERRQRKSRACPKWLTEEQLGLIKEFYKNRPKGYHIDHIVPLKGKEVCGLHVPWNLQYLPARENLKKGNKLS